MKLRNKIFVATLLGGLFFSSCSKDVLDLVNPNEPSPEALLTEEGIARAGLGVYSKFGLNYWWLSLTNHNIMSDQTWSSVGNFSWRWTNQPTKIILDDGTVLTPPVGGAQGTELKNRNDRAFGTDNVFFVEWSVMYLVNNQANLILNKVDNPALQLSGSEAAIATKKATLRAWAYWWKGFAYSRIGSLYVAGLIANEFDTVTNTTVINNSYKDRAAILAEAAANFDKCAAELDKVTDNNAYRALLTKMIPAHTVSPVVTKAGIFTQAEWKRQINTFKARNILVSKRVGDVTVAEWDNILTLTQDTMRQTDKILTMRTADENAVLGNSSAGWTPWRILTNTWEFVSERWVQDFKPGDARRDRNIILRATAVVNNSGRGFQYGTRWALKDIVNGGDWVSQTVGVAELPIACTYEEALLTRAEALIMTGAIEDGLILIDLVRTFQRANLPAVAGTGLNQAQAYEELRSERRIALFIRGTGFYDTRRWGWTVVNGQRTGVVVLGPSGAVNTNATIVYNYLDYWDVPLNELDFNTPGSGSAPVVFPL